MKRAVGGQLGGAVHRFVVALSFAVGHRCKDAALERSIAAHVAAHSLAIRAPGSTRTPGGSRFKQGRSHARGAGAVATHMERSPQSEVAASAQKPVSGQQRSPHGVAPSVQGVQTPSIVHTGGAAGGECQMRVQHGLADAGALTLADSTTRLAASSLVVKARSARRRIQARVTHLPLCTARAGGQAGEWVGGQQAEARAGACARPRLARSRSQHTSPHGLWPSSHTSALPMQLLSMHRWLLPQHAGWEKRWGGARVFFKAGCAPRIHVPLGALH